MSIIEITPEMIQKIKDERTLNVKTRKVTDDQVRLVRLLDEQGLKNGEIAKFVNLPPQYVSHIRRGKSYKDVQGSMSLKEATELLSETSEEEVPTE